MKNKVILIGAIDKGQLATNGETMKNQLFLRRFNEIFDKVITVDTYNWRSKPFVILKILWILITHPRTNVILSASRNIRYLLNFLYYVPINRNLYIWVVGGSHEKLIKEGIYSIKTQRNMKKIIVQGKSMVKGLCELGLDNAVYVPNSKPINYKPNIQPKPDGEAYRFVFLSRIYPTKGIQEIVDACDILKKMGYDGQFTIDFYGAIEKDYEETFKSLINNHSEISYQGYLNLMDKKGYQKLSSYDVMLFPTYWDGEGFPGVVLDAYISGLPIIATEWNLNSEVIENGKTGLLIPVHDAQAIACKMLDFINNKYDLLQMREYCVKYVQQFDYRNVITEELMLRLGLLK